MSTLMADKPTKDPLASPMAVDPEKSSLHQGEAVPLEDDLYAPLRGVAEYDPSQRLLTVRSIITGAVLGSLVNCGNIYLGLKSGLGMDSVLFATVFGYMIIVTLQQTKLPLLRTPFGPHENNIVQAVASGSVGIGFLFITAVPAMFRLDLMNRAPTEEYGRLLVFSLVSGFFGLSFTVALRKMFIISLGRKMGLIFPGGAAAALVIRTLHSRTRRAVDGGPQTRKTILVPLLTFVACLIWPIGAQYAPGVLYSINFLWYIFKWGGHDAVYAVNWGWATFLTSPAYLGIGMLMDIKASASFLSGTIISWGIIGPLIVKLGYATGLPISDKYPQMMTFNAMIPENFSSNPSPRYWMLWPAVFLMLATSITRIALEWNLLWGMMQYGFSRAKSIIHHLSRRSQSELTGDVHQSNVDDGDPISSHQQVRGWEWLSLLVAVLAIALPSLKYLYSIPVGVSLVTLITSVFWSFVAIQTYGTASTTPITVISKASQFVSGGMMKGSYPVNQAMLANLSTAGVAGGTAQAAAILISDLKTGFLLKTPSRAQFYAQAIGTTVGVILSPAFFILFCKAYPCILDPDALTCSFNMPAMGAWQAVALGVLAETFPISKSSWVFSIILTVVGILITILDWALQRSKHSRSWFARILPDMTLVGLAMTTPGTDMAITIFVGTLIVMFWTKLSKKSFDTYGYPVAAGAISGESLAFVVQAIFQIAQIGGPNYYGSMVGCVGDSC